MSKTYPDGSQESPLGQGYISAGGAKKAQQQVRLQARVMLIQKTGINMGLFFKVSDKKLLDIRNRIFIEQGIPALNKNGFSQSPSHWYGKDNLGGYMYTLCRISKESHLEMMMSHNNMVQIK